MPVLCAPVVETKKAMGPDVISAFLIAQNLEWPESNYVTEPNAFGRFLGSAGAAPRV